VVEPALLICDEVVSALDVSVQATVLNLLREICDTRGAALMFVSHGLPATAFISDTLVVMQQDRIVDAGTTWDVLLHSDQAYTSALREAYDLTAAPGSTSLPEEGILR
jgi:peptide/nickel transport system ATP-binding protein